ncbi:MAG: hypothetical protein NTU54_01195 [Candidatus Omnitrophica bacterium]|nr:hypothetical protein [Candidatus Omnitrophota bacterium]
MGLLTRHELFEGETESIVGAEFEALAAEARLKKRQKKRVKLTPFKVILKLRVSFNLGIKLLGFIPWQVN